MKTVSGKIEGNFTKECAQKLFHHLEQQMVDPDEKKVALVIDCLTMTDYTTEARTVFTDWMARHKSAIAKVAIITPKTVWHMAIASMSVVSGLPMRGFATLTEAKAYIAESSARVG